MAHLCFVRLRTAGALVFLLTLAQACGVPDYNVPAVPDAGGILPDATGGSNATGGNGATGGSNATSSGGSSSNTGGAGGGGNSSLSTGGQPTQDVFNCATDANCSSFSATKVCDTSASPSRCVECLPGSKPCPAGSGLYCGQDKECHVGCTSNADCGSVACDASKCDLLTCDPLTHQCTGCNSDADCGKGTECDAATKHCVPRCGTSSTCPAGWTCCQNTTCVNLQSDEANCFYCGNICPNSNATAQCLNGACRIDKCDSGYDNCDKLNSNGCEKLLSADPKNCGACGTACSATQVCKLGVCSEASCTGSFANCDTADPNCETDTDNNVQHCGSCLVACNSTNGIPSCNAGVCSITCTSGFGDCNNRANDGCETSLKDSTDNCGACGAKCTNDHGTTTCATGSAGTKCSPSCGAGFADCNGNPADGCEVATTTEVNNCGACGKVCALAHATAACTNSICTIATCQTDWADCNNDPSDGCETNLPTSATHCGTCSNACNTTNGTASCAAGQCGITCVAGFANCDANASNGCEVNLNTSVDNCNACKNVCPDQPNGTAICRSGVCGLTNCQAPFGDCDSNPNNGCEANTDGDPNNCGGCGNKCVIAHATAKCTLGVCGISTCDPGFADCDGSPANGCEVNLKTDTSNCNACGAKCAPANAVGSCVAGACIVTSCTGNFQDCDGTPTNGCEADTSSSVTNCGRCGTPGNPATCDNTHGTPGCSGGVCTIACAAGFGNCDGNAANGCEATTTSNASNCGTCGTTCVAASGTPACLNSACTVAGCNAGFADCDAKYSNGCEARLTTDAANCGACNNICNSSNGTASCANGACSVACSAGFGNCDTLVSNGCEINLSTSMQNCGTCGQTCAPANATATCAASNCSITACNTGFANCNALIGDGCEINLTSDPNHCNTCSTVCSFANATAGCNSGVCALGACDAGYANCDGAAANGCEINLKTDPAHCNSCSTVCAYTNASATCSNGTCAIGTCTAGFANCDGSPVNGCEVNLTSDVNNCNACGTKCPTTGGTPVCTAGACGYSTCGAGLATCPPGATCATNTTNDVNNCGGCGTKCTFANAAASCVSSTCTMGACTAGSGNCDGSAANGCEVNLKTDANNCNACGTKCTFANASATCGNGACAMGACNAGFADCDGNPANGCEINLKTDVNNCNACNTKCSTSGGTPTCTNGSCGIGCAAGFGDCDSNPANGCETNLNSPTHCGGCNTVCSSTNGTATCSAGVCGITCNAGYGDCDGSAANGCEINTNTNPNYCGNCSTVCGAINGTASCTGGVCGIACTAGYGNCDANFANGCETTLATNAAHCGNCATACTYTNASGVCSASVCQLGTCNAGYGNCDSTASNGCEVALNTTTDCGTCSNACTNAHGTTACTAGSCVPACSSGYSSCDSNAANGCEQNTGTDVNHCGTCTNVCSYAHATPACSGGACSMGACAYLYGNCNGSTADGCEKPLTADTSNCGVCGTVCSSNHGTASCSGGACSIACSAGYANCDGSAANGCEINTQTDSNNCGSCGNVCATSCVAGVCAGPCGSYCSSPTAFAGGNFNSGNLGTGTFCYQTSGTVNGGNCSNFVSPRTLSVNGTVMNCGGWTLPAKVNGGYCVYGPAGGHTYDAFATW